MTTESDAYRCTEPGQTFLGTDHNIANYEKANYLSNLADTDSFEQWTDNGALDVQQRANRIGSRC